MIIALEVTVGPAVLTINNGCIFLVSELDGSISPASDQGLDLPPNPHKYRRVPAEPGAVCAR